MLTPAQAHLLLSDSGQTSCFDPSEVNTVQWFYHEITGDLHRLDYFTFTLRRFPGFNQAGMPS